MEVVLDWEWNLIKKKEGLTYRKYFLVRTCDLNMSLNYIIIAYKRMSLRVNGKIKELPNIETFVLFGFDTAPLLLKWLIYYCFDVFYLSQWFSRNNLYLHKVGGKRS